MFTIPGMERTSVVTIRRSSGMAEMRRSTRSRRAIRATTANAPTAGMSDSTMIVKSKTFQPSRK